MKEIGGSLKDYKKKNKKKRRQLLKNPQNIYKFLSPIKENDEENKDESKIDETKK